MRGKRLCEAVEFEILGEVPGLYQCHCSLCRKQGGSTSNTATIVANNKFRWLKGEEKFQPLRCRQDSVRTFAAPVAPPCRIR